MPRYEDCESCAFYEEEPAMCDECEDADQWEPADSLGLVRPVPMNYIPMKKAA